MNSFISYLLYGFGGLIGVVLTGVLGLMHYYHKCVKPAREVEVEQEERVERERRLQPRNLELLQLRPEALYQDEREYDVEHGKLQQRYAEQAEKVRAREEDLSALRPPSSPPTSCVSCGTTLPLTAAEQQASEDRRAAERRVVAAEQRVDELDRLIMELYREQCDHWVRRRQLYREMDELREEWHAPSPEPQLDPHPLDSFYAFVTAFYTFVTGLASAWHNSGSYDQDGSDDSNGSE